jgi:hypothetical protein
VVIATTERVLFYGPDAKAVAQAFTKMPVPGDGHKAGGSLLRRRVA